MSMGDELEKLRALHERGALSDAEYAAAKERVLRLGQAGNGAGDFLHRWHRSRSDRWLGGVCGGLAQLVGLPSWVLRLCFCLMLFFAGAGIILYLLLWIFVPEEPAG